MKRRSWRPCKELPKYECTTGHGMGGSMQSYYSYVTDKRINNM